jgi:hypothetical protein
MAFSFFNCREQGRGAPKYRVVLRFGVGGLQKSALQRRQFGVDGRRKAALKIDQGVEV